MPNSASQIRTAVFEHGAENRIECKRRIGDDLETSLVAVCCSSDSSDRRCAPAARRGAARSLWR